MQYTSAWPAVLNGEDTVGRYKVLEDQKRFVQDVATYIKGGPTMKKPLEKGE